MQNKKRIYKNGANRERKRAHKLREEGYYVMRSAGSHGEFDLIALHKETKTGKLIQMKGKKSTERFKENLKEKLKHFEGTYVLYVEVID